MRRNRVQDTLRERILRTAGVLLLLLALPILLFGQSQRSPRPKPLAFTHVTIIDATGAPASLDMTVVITGDRITALGKTKSTRVPAGARLIDAKGRFLIPGLWDMHVHLTQPGESSLPLFIANGVTSVRDMGGDFAKIKSWRDKISAGTLLGPRIKTAGPILESPRFIKLIEQLAGSSEAASRLGVGTPADAARVVELVKSLGADCLKFRTNASRETFFAIATEAKRLGIPLVGHAPTGVTLIEASDAGQRSIEHGLIMPGAEKSEIDWKETFAHFVKNGTFVVPTLIAGRNYRLLPDSEVISVVDDSAGVRDRRRKYASTVLIEFWRKQISLKKYESPLDWKVIINKDVENLRMMREAGVRIMAGTDLGVPLVFPGFGLLDELELLVKEGRLTPLEALQSATRTPADFFGLGEVLGTVEKEKIADLVLLEADPLADINNTRRIAAVVVGGRLLSKESLRKVLADVEATVKSR